MKAKALALCLGALTVLTGCDSDSSFVTSRPDSGRPASSQQVDVFNDYVASASVEPEAAAAKVDNLFTNGGFENGIQEWSGCSGGDITPTGDALDGTSAMAITAGGCTYRSIAITPGEMYTLSCYVKLDADIAWTGMGMTFSDSEYKAVHEAPEAEATSTQFVKLSSTATAPANASFVSAWVYSDSGAVVDNCSLQNYLEPVQPPLSGDNLLENGDFSEGVHHWSIGCGGSSSSNGGSLYVADGACVDQSLSADDMEQLSRRTLVYSCLVTDVEGYADMSVYLDDEVAAERSIKASDKNTRVTLTVDNVNASNGFVSLYASSYLTVEDCQVFATGDAIPPGGLLSFESEDSHYDHTIGTYELDANGNPTNLQAVIGRSAQSQPGTVLGQFGEAPIQPRSQAPRSLH